MSFEVPGRPRLEDAHRELQLAVETAKLGIWRLNLKTNKLTWNDRLLAIYNLTRAEFDGELSAWRDRVHPEDREGAELRLAEANKGHSVFDVEFRVVWPGGELRYINASAAPILDEHGEVVELVGINIDVTAIRAREQALKRREAFHRSLFDRSLAAMMVADDAGNYVLANQAAAELFGVSQSKLLTMSVRDIETVKGPPGEERYEAYVQQGAEIGEFEFLRPDGQARIAQYSATRIGEDQNLSVLIDITEPRHLDRQILHTQKMEALGRLAGGVAHELNNALMVVMNSAELAIDPSTPEDERLELLKSIEEAGGQGATIVQQLLTFGRQHPVQRAPLQLNRIIQGIEEMLRRLLGDGFELVTRLAADLPWVYAEAAHVEQILMNLVVNARDALTDGGTVTIETRVKELTSQTARVNVSPGRYVLLSVRDDGSGIDPEIATQVFEPFFTTKPQGEGSGLGLAAVYGLARQCGGHVTVQSRLHEGTCFEVYLPAPEPPKPPSERTSPNDRLPRGDETLLVVDDEPGPRLVLVRMLERAGYRVLVASTGEEAFELFQRRASEIDLVVTDILMPGLSGRDLAEKIHAQAPEKKILFVSGYASSDVIADLDGRLLLGKPFTQSELLHRVRALLDGA